MHPPQKKIIVSIYGPAGVFYFSNSIHDIEKVMKN
jgi:hypothetical protein